MEEFDVEIVKETDEAVLIDFGGDEEVWLPKSQIDFQAPYSEGDIVTIEVPEWLASKHGMI